MLLLPDRHRNGENDGKYSKKRVIDIWKSKIRVRIFHPLTEVFEWLGGETIDRIKLKGNNHYWISN